MPPPASPRKRPRPSSLRSPGTPRGAPKPPTEITWSSRAQHIRETFFDLFNNFIDASYAGVEVKEILYRLSNLRLTIADIIRKIDEHCSLVADAVPKYAYLCTTFSQETQTEELLPPPPTNAKPTETAVQTESTPAPPPKTYSQAATSPTPQRTQLQRRTPTAKKPAVSTTSTTSTTSSPTRVIANLNDQPQLGARELSPTELHRRLTAAVSNTPNTPSLLGVKWNKKGNLILSYPPGTPHNLVKPQFPAICSVLDSQSKVEFRFDVPWRRVHLANIWARENAATPIASEEELRETLHLNPTIQSLNITIQASWLKKPGLVTGTHTSAVIAFEDPDGSIERGLLKSTIFAFGEAITVKKWHDKPRSKSC